MGCGVLAVLPGKKGFVLEKILQVLESEKNRGDDGSGLLFLKNGKFIVEKWAGTARDIPRHVFDNLMNSPTARKAELVLGHARYATKGKINLDNNHPVIASKGNTSIAIVMNGEVSFTERWRETALSKGIDLHGSTNDSVACAAKILMEFIEGRHLNNALLEFYKQAFPFGGFTILGALIEGKKGHFFYLREGLRPLHFTEFNGSRIFFSETSHARGLGEAKALEVPAGSIGVLDLKKEKWKKTNVGKKLKGTSLRALCPYEIAYFQNYDSKVNGLTVDNIRRDFGRELAREHPPEAGSVISWIPNSGINATQGYFEKALDIQSGVKFRQVITRREESRKRGERSFLGYKSMSLDEKLKRKFKILFPEVKGEKVVLIDDSIVRGSVAAWLSKKFKKSEAKSVSLFLAWPPMIGGCKAGIDLDDSELIAPKLLKVRDIVKNQEKLEKKLSEKGFRHKRFGLVKFNAVRYVSVSGVKKVFAKHLKGRICTGCFEGNYSYIHKGNACCPPKWLVEFIEKNKVEKPKELK